MSKPWVKQLNINYLSIKIYLISERNGTLNAQKVRITGVTEYINLLLLA